MIHKIRLSSGEIAREQDNYKWSFSDKGVGEFARDSQSKNSLIYFF